jgi:hypothetical protein
MEVCGLPLYPMGLVQVVGCYKLGNKSLISMKCRELKLRKMMVFLGFKLLSKGLFWHLGGICCLFFEGDYLAQLDAEVIGRKEV